MTVQYDQKIMREYADRLYAMAAEAIWTYTLGYGILGMIIGGIAGYLATHEHVFVVFFGLGLGVILAIIGWHIANEKAFHLKLEAQKTLCQVQIEENTRLQEERVCRVDRGEGKE